MHDTYRAASLEETYNVISPFTKEMGITRVANITGLDVLGIPVYMVCRPNSRSLSVSQGKGASPLAAKISGLMESIEGYHAENMDHPTITGSCLDLHSDNQNYCIENLSRLSTKIFNENTVIRWVQGIDLISNLSCWVPYECAHADCSAPWPEDHGYFITDSNGLASGNTLTEAINHALYEVIERDALALWSHKNAYEKMERKIRVDSVNNSIFQDFIRSFQNASVKFAIWEITTDIGIPTYMCKILPEQYSENAIRPAYGSGTHKYPMIALMRAVTEAAQSRLTFIAGSRDDQPQSSYKSQAERKIWEKWNNEIGDEGKRNFIDIPVQDNQSPLLDQKFLINQCVSAGIKNILCINLTKQKFKIPVVKVLVPGLEGISHSGTRIMGKRGRAAYLKNRTQN